MANNPSSKPVCRFAPSPTGYLHIGGARTALFNWLFAKHTGGAFRLRIEDTDRARSTPEATEAIIDGMKWLGLDWDGEVVHQYARAERHAAVALELLAKGGAYYCYASPQELEEMRSAQKAAGKPIRYDGRWRDRDPKDAPAGIKPVVRLKARQDGETIIRDKVQGDVVVKNEQLDDMILLRADGNPTYMLSVVVDDHDMGVTHVIRGDDHLNNAARQMQLIERLGWPVPVYAHIPLIHGPDGAKLSKRHGALAVDAYRDMGYLPEAMRNYLLRLGWGHGDDEIITTAQAIEWFDLDGVGRSPSRFDFKKLDNLNGHYMRHTDDARLVEAALPLVEKAAGQPVDAAARARLTAGMGGLKARAKTLLELANAAVFYVRARPIALDDAARKHLGAEGLANLKIAAGLFAVAPEWKAAALETTLREAAETGGLKLGALAQPVRAALSGQGTSPPIFEVMEILGREEALGRISDALGGA
ncbi:MAG: glutamate--tRNA ligase [Proteobacteria bacterium]|nr:glutamate--tRNA ligase [Pseudomonadota bacterium]